ncbi:hypothetical protein MHYP_G00358420 [Metynnis hypsauchen]
METSLAAYGEPFSADTDAAPSLQAVKGESAILLHGPDKGAGQKAVRPRSLAEKPVNHPRTEQRVAAGVRLHCKSHDLPYINTRPPLVLKAETEKSE